MGAAQAHTHKMPRIFKLSFRNRILVQGAQDRREFSWTRDSFSQGTSNKIFKTYLILQAHSGSKTSAQIVFTEVFDGESLLLIPVKALLVTIWRARVLSLERAQKRTTFG